MFRFQHIEYLWLLLFIPLMVLVFFIYKRWQSKRTKQFIDKSLYKDIAGSFSSRKTTWKFIFITLAILCTIIALSNPQFGDKTKEVKSKGIDIMIALDVSNSMKAQDIQPDRLDRAKMVIRQLINNLHGDRIGIVVFAGQAFVQVPITSDYVAAKMFLPTITPGIVPVQGTAIGDAINLCTSSFDIKSPGAKAIIVISDGENHEPGAVQAANDAADKGIKIYTIGMGSVNGAPIPIYKNGKQSGYMKDDSGKTVVTKLNPEMMKAIASAGNGAFVRANNSDLSLSFILNKINHLKKAEHKSMMYQDFESRFQVFIALAIIFLLAEILLSTRKAAWVEKIQLFKEKEIDA